MLCSAALEVFLCDAAFSIILALAISPVGAASTCFGTTSNGRLDGACKLPSSGENFDTYSHVLRLAGRTYVHCRVQRVVLDAYELVSRSQPDAIYVYGETGKKNGGPFPPHKTHQNGLSVDFMVPVVREDGASVALPTSIINKYGYDIDFSLDGKYENLRIDYEALASHLAALKIAANKEGIGIWRIIFDPEMQSALQKTATWPEISSMNFSTRRSWVRHDDHYHVDFVVPCEAM